MTVFDHQRLNSVELGFDYAGIRRGAYSDQYFANVISVLTALRDSGYRYAGTRPRPLPVDLTRIPLGDLVVEAQIFTRRTPHALIAGVDAALALIRNCTGYWLDDQFVETWKSLEVDAVEDGVIIPYDGHPEHVLPVIKLRGCYRDFALLETPLLGVLTRASRLATNILDVLRAASGKPVLFFPARFDLPETQTVDGYAYWLAVQCYNHETGLDVPAVVSTDQQGAWWGGHGGGTIPHALIAAFFGDTAEAMVAFAQVIPITVPRYALVDFNNDSVGDSLATAAAFWTRYRAALEAGNADEQRRWTLDGVRLDTSLNVRDLSLNDGDPYGVNAKLVQVVRAALDRAWAAWEVPDELITAAQAYCANIKIVVTGGFNAERITHFEKQGVPVDVYGVGSTLLRNDSATNTDFTMDVVRVQIDGVWYDVSKIGRQPNANPDLQPVKLGEL
jgi:nicotinate phosphoribosyltransferase